MSTIKVDTITDEAGSGAPDFPNGMTASSNVTFTSGIDVTGAAAMDGVTVDGTLNIEEVIEKCEIAASTTGSFNINALTGAVVYYSSSQTANRQINFRGDASNTLNSLMAVGQSMTFAVLMAQGATAYYLNTYQVDSSAVTPKWSGGEAPTEGNASGIDVYTFTIIKTADATFTVLASLTQYA